MATRALILWYYCRKLDPDWLVFASFAAETCKQKIPGQDCTVWARGIQRLLKSNIRHGILNFSWKGDTVRNCQDVLRTVHQSCHGYRSPFRSYAVIPYGPPVSASLCTSASSLLTSGMTAFPHAVIAWGPKRVATLVKAFDMPVWP